MSTEQNDLLFDPYAVNDALKSVNHMDDLFKKDGALQLIFKKTMESMLQEELSEHLGYRPRDNKSKKTDNSRNGSYKKNVKTSAGEVELNIPRDRDGSFEPKIIPKYQNKCSDLESKVISMYAKGMTTRDIEAHLKEVYFGVEISATTISNITSKVLDMAKEWQSRPLAEVYPIVFFDAIHYKVRKDGKIISKAAYICLGINQDGIKEILGIYLGENESSAYWLSVLTDLQNRGVDDILIASIDGLKGFPEAIKTIFPKTEIQVCIVHQIRNSLKYIGSKYQKEFLKDLKLVYKAPTLEAAESALDELAQKWGEKYPVVINSWVNNWDRLSTYFCYSEPIRRIIYTTNIIEGLHRQMRKVTKNRSMFPSDDSLFKILYLVSQDVSKKWKTPKWRWGEVISQLSIYFEGRVKIDLA
jgi:putative transposase